jgi:transposase
MQLEMGSKERERLVVIRQVVDGKLRQKEAAERLGICKRQLKRLVQRWRSRGDSGLVSLRRGRSASNALPVATRKQLEGLLQKKYPDFGATLATEKLAALDGLHVSRETVRQVQVKLGLHKPKVRRKERVFQSRERRSRFGELVQIDGSPHDWFEGRAPKCTLIVFIDDATSKLTSLLFAPCETAHAYLLALRQHIKAYGLPLALYSDRHGIFRVNAKESVSGDGLTEFGRALGRLNIASICAHTPQAKGRVERANQTLQDRLIKEMRLCGGVSTMEEGNAFLPAFIRAWNEGDFVKPARENADAHRPWIKGDTALDEALARHEARTLSKSLTFQYGGVSYAVKTKGPGTALRGVKITVMHHLAGQMVVRYKDRTLSVTPYKTRPIPPPTEDEKTIDARMATIISKVQQNQHETQQIPS